VAVALRTLFESAISSYDPARLVQEHLAARPLWGQEFTVLALGKAAVPMMCGARSALGERIRTEVVVAPTIPTGAPPGWFASSHPTPSHSSETAAHALLAGARASAGPVLALLSGGGSALAELPPSGLSLQETTAQVSDVYASGADIEELNIVRKHLSSFKGGQLAAASPHPVRTLVLSDVLGDCLSIVASGPTVPDSSTFADALQIVEARCGADVAGAAVEYLRAGAAGLRAETPKEARAGDEAILLAGIRSFVDHTVEHAASMGARAVENRGLFDGSVHDVATMLSKQILEAPPRPAVWIWGGEATIVLPHGPGLGGRAQHLALLLAEQIADMPGVQILAAGSDGIDGNSQAAGALVDGATWLSIRKLGLDARAALRACDSARVLAAAGAQIVTGPTGVNHADLVIVQFS
jgi:glycerate-2-kinase